MTYSYTQISRHLGCPRRYRHQYLDGWQEKDSRASMRFGRAFEKALAAYFLREDCSAVLYREWSQYREQGLQFSGGDTWDRMLEQGIQLLGRFAQEDRVRVARPQRNLQVKFTRPLRGGNDFVAYVDAIGRLDGTRRLLEWKTTSSRYPEEPEGLLQLDPQLLCYSWITGIADVAEVVFVRKRLPESSVPAHHDQRHPARGIRSPGRSYRRADPGWALPAPQRHSFSPKPLHQLPLPGTLPG